MLNDKLRKVFLLSSETFEQIEAKFLVNNVKIEFSKEYINDN